MPRPAFHPASDEAPDAAPDRREEDATRSVAFTVLVSVAAAAVLFLIAASLLTIPLFALAQFTEPGRGTGREWFREGLRWAALGGATVAIAAGAGLAWWLRRGAMLPAPPKPWETE